MAREKGNKRKPRPQADPPWAADESSVARVQAAVEAAGLNSIAELADLMVDGGFTAVMPKDDVTERYTLQDLGTRLWGSLQERGKDERVEWFDSLNDVQKRALIIVLRDNGYHFEVIAREFNIDTRDVIRTWNHHCDEIGAQVVGLRLDTIAGQLMMQASKAQQMAIQSGDHSAFWRIAKDYVGVLQDLGVLDRAAQRHEVKHKFDDQKKMEIDAMVQLEKKKDARYAEIRVVEDADMEAEKLPASITQDYDDDDGLEQEKP